MATMADPNAEEKELEAKLQRLRQQKASPATPAAANADLMQYVSKLSEQDIMQNPKDTQTILQSLAGEVALLKTDKQRAYDEMKSSLNKTLERLNDLSKRTNAAPPEFEQMLASYVNDGTSLNELIKANRIFSSINTAMSAALQTPAPPPAAPIAEVVVHQQQPPQQQAVAPQVVYQQYQEMTKPAESKPYSMKQLAAEIGGQFIATQYHMNALQSNQRYTNYTPQPMYVTQAAPMMVPQTNARPVVTAASAAASTVVDEPNSKRPRLSDYVSNERIEALLNTMNSSPQGVATKLRDEELKR